MGTIGCMTGDGSVRARGRYRRKIRGVPHQAAVVGTHLAFRPDTAGVADTDCVGRPSARNACWHRSGPQRCSASAAITRSDVPHTNDDVTFLVPAFGQPMGLGDLVQRIASVDNRPEFPSLDQILEV